MAISSNQVANPSVKPSCKIKTCSKEVLQFTYHYMSIFISIAQITGLCNWQQETNDTFDWERQTGSAVILPENGPLFDHTVGNIEGIVRSSVIRFYVSSTVKMIFYVYCNYFLYTTGIVAPYLALAVKHNTICSFLCLIGFYLIISSQGTANEAVISGPMISDATQLCLSFWYYMFGSSVSTLAVLVHTVRRSL